MPLGPAIRKACGTRPERKAASSAASASAWPNKAVVARGCGASSVSSSSLAGLIADRSRRHVFNDAPRGRRLKPRFHRVPNFFGDRFLGSARIDDDAARQLFGGDGEKSGAQLLVKFQIFRLEPVGHGS